MATIDAVLVSTKNDKQVWIWGGCADGDTCTALDPMSSGSLGMCVQFIGTFGGTIVMQGSNDGTNWFTLSDLQGNAVSTSSAGAFEVSTSAAFIRPSPGASVSDVDVLVCMRG